METCPICCETIVDATEDAEGQEALFCEGPCQKRLHRWCASVHKDSYAVLTSSEEPFVCPSCSLAEHCRLIKSLAKTVEYLKCEIQELKRSKLRHPRAAPTQTCKKSLTRRLCPRLVGSLQYNLSWWQNSSHYLPLSLWKIKPNRRNRRNKRNKGADGKAEGDTWAGETRRPQKHYEPQWLNVKDLN